jgi:hypothetical protein
MCGIAQRVSLAKTVLLVVLHCQLDGFASFFLQSLVLLT